MWNCYVSHYQCLSLALLMESGVPQGSVLGLIPFLTYVSDIASTVQNHDINVHLFADDILLYQSTLSESLSILNNNFSVHRQHKWLPELKPPSSQLHQNSCDVVFFTQVSSSTVRTDPSLQKCHQPFQNNQVSWISHWLPSEPQHQHRKDCQRAFLYCGVCVPSEIASQRLLLSHWWHRWSCQDWITASLPTAAPLLTHSSVYRVLFTHLPAWWKI